MEGKKKKELTEYEKKLEEFKYEVARELGLEEKVKDVGWQNLSAKECGRLGGKMGGKIGGALVQRMIAHQKDQSRRT